MSKFLTNVSLTRYPDQTDSFQIDSNLIFEYHKLYKIVVYSGFKTDGASVPKIFRWFVDPFSGNYLPAAIVHDALYQSQILTREESDLIFLNGMLTCGVSPIKAEILFQAVSLFGNSAWTVNSKNINYSKNYIAIKRVDENV